MFRYVITESDGISPSSSVLRLGADEGKGLFSFCYTDKVRFSRFRDHLIFVAFIIPQSGSFVKQGGMIGRVLG